MTITKFCLNIIWNMLEMQYSQSDINKKKTSRAHFIISYFSSNHFHLQNIRIVKVNLILHIMKKRYVKSCYT